MLNTCIAKRKENGRHSRGCSKRQLHWQKIISLCSVCHMNQTFNCKDLQPSLCFDCHRSLKFGCYSPKYAQMRHCSGEKKTCNVATGSKWCQTCIWHFCCLVFYYLTYTAIQIYYTCEKLNLNFSVICPFSLKILVTGWDEYCLLWIVYCVSPHDSQVAHSHIANCWADVALYPEQLSSCTSKSYLLWCIVWAYSRGCQTATE